MYLSLLVGHHPLAAQLEAGRRLRRGVPPWVAQHSYQIT